MSENTPDPASETKAIGKTMALIAWIIGMLLATQFFGAWEEKQINPNRSPESYADQNGQHNTVLKRNRAGHYLTHGKINAVPVTFLLDTGATDVVIPAALAARLGLPRLGKNRVQTANGEIDVYGTVIESLEFGNISLRAVRAAINPNMGPDEEILLGMSALKQVDFRQENGELILKQYRP
jgi:aspartyl protease family protein